ncbi:MAG: cupin domain-containing protein [Chitinophagaceae bacterium]|nr:cupin domain-containing protein [Chitinophagaceae bacterium]MBK8299066.1 cupin domain-containing protein [Chitinophagaceae bacterium]MBK9659752.1 cupin domain-containing protein [Chitinophagaceae bacterium]MBP6415501.1 cupin domain-containing protein [Chitinophagaceae bacterium]MBP8115373.1 cupin domain-containing protein [Chitinophagaceae bacterium]
MINNNSNRRDAILQLFAAGIGFSSLLSSCSSSKSSTVENVAADKKLLPFFIPPTPPLQPGPGGLDIKVLIKSSQTNSQFSCVEFAVAPKKMGPAPHYHKNLDELMYVLEGIGSVLIEDTLYEIPAGGWHLRPRGIEHTFFNATDKPFRAIDMYFNQNFEDYLEEVFHKITPEMRKNDKVNVDKRMAELHIQFGMVGFPEKRKPIIDKYRLIA